LIKRGGNESCVRRGIIEGFGQIVDSMLIPRWLHYFRYLRLCRFQKTSATTTTSSFLLSPFTSEFVSSINEPWGLTLGETGPSDDLVFAKSRGLSGLPQCPAYCSLLRRTSGMPRQRNCSGPTGIGGNDQPQKTHAEHQGSEGTHTV
jgi:hypothetical protein